MLAGYRGITEAVFSSYLQVDIQHQHFCISVTTLGFSSIEAIIYCRCAS